MKQYIVTKTSCIMCNKTSKNGIIIRGKYICSECETKIVNSDINTDFYEYYKNHIKKNISLSLIKENIEL
ncbi:Inhibitor of sigma-G Gin [Clostridium cavendishii DSM 21758]|uniref:Inhibitor of sigma-G Gin n=1 Tax=Clostridium cavendishii DSM 21758 TaxID=1121302 RepID=A0A1M6UZY5_9CLOT|nr:sigma factor G inhibitor Gin [Clostridium cavendishii]SHK74748.1 Inhibitor of sigma-G Gin [Clostridium cavendishii DSM 21758]